jgi:multicomponent K+:H+ antiporter subunit D
MNWTLIGLLIVSGLATMIVMTRAGIDLLWTPGEDAPSRLSLVEVAPIALLLAVCLALMLWAGPVMAYLEATSAALHDPAGYLSAVAGAPPAGSAQP